MFKCHVYTFVRYSFIHFQKYSKYSWQFNIAKFLAERNDGLSLTRLDPMRAASWALTTRPRPHLWNPYITLLTIILIFLQSRHAVQVSSSVATMSVYQRYGFVMETLIVSTSPMNLIATVSVKDSVFIYIYLGKYC